ncbi:MAG: hypothetical protein EOP67_50675, partial [Sphingomonas sp.]
MIGLAATTSITGGYRQASGGLYLLGGPLVVEGVASLTGGTVATRLPSAVNYLAGSIAATLVRGGAGSSYAGVEVDTGDTPGLALRGGASGSDLVVTALNHYIGATLASLTNSGSIASGYGLFVAESGSLGSMTNSGTLAGSIAAIHNDGTLGPIINTGVIAGNIDNLSAQALQIRGGTLTGYAPDSQGTITSNRGDVVLGGTIVLNHYVGATLGSLTNSGSVAQAYPVYVATTGSLGSLTNSGTLSGSIAAIYTAGTLGQITNSGLIAGNIENASAQGLRIAGGTGTVFGTLTGNGAGRGTISSATAPVAFTAGNLLLDDDIVATGLVVSNTGAVLRLPNSASITGGYSQTAGELALASGTRLVVSG